jgi:thiamine pyrophosphokinase
MDQRRNRALISLGGEPVSWNRALVFLGGEPVPRNRFESLLSGSLLIAADSGAAWLEEANIRPHVLLGDFDSLNPALRAKLEHQVETVLPFPAKKDQTDGELAVDLALSRNIGEIVLIGGLGGRVDHSIGNVALLFKIARRKRRGWMLDADSRIYPVPRRLQLDGIPGQMFSLLALSPVSGLTIRGATYPMQEGSMILGQTLGLSNRFLHSTVRLEKEKGLLLAILLDNTAKNRI